MSDPETGMMILEMVYRAGFTNPWHSHPCAHGAYVLDGTLSTHQGRYPAGSFVWFPEGGVMEHGTTQEEDRTFLFMTTGRSTSTSPATRTTRLRRRLTSG
jgi:quercetin dioxygenase-like cupin family protein